MCLPIGLRLQLPRKLYFDERYVGDHKDGEYQPFWFRITQSMMNAP